MRKNFFPPLSILILFCLNPLCLKLTAADVLTPCYLKLSIFEGLPGVNTTDFVFEPKYPGSPDQVVFLKSFDSQDGFPGGVFDDFGGRIEGFLTPQESGNYEFFLRSDDGSELWLSTNDNEANGQIIAEEFECCNPFMEPDTGAPATSFPISLTAGSRYFIMVNYKEGEGGDFAQVAWRKVGDTTPAADLSPISGAFLSVFADDSQAPAITITQDPQSLTGEENSLVTFTVSASTTPSTDMCIQWQRNGINIPGANGATFTTLLSKSDNGAKFRALVAVPGAFMESGEATTTVTDDKTAPTVASVRGVPNQPSVTVTFSERVTESSGTSVSNYKIASASGDLAVTAAELSEDRTTVTLTTGDQTIGDEYTLTINNVQDVAGTANSIAPDTQSTFFGLGPWLQGEDGFVIFEAEDFDRNLDGLWVTDKSRGEPSGGVAMLIPNGSADNENNTKLEYDILFTKTGTHIFWYRAGADSGSDDSAWLHLDGERPPDRLDGNRASMAGFNGNIWEWNSDPQEGPSPMTFDITSPGLHTISLATREDGAFFDKFAITTDPAFDPDDFGPFGPPTTLREGEPLPGGVSLDITTQPVDTEISEHETLIVTTVAEVPPEFLISYQWQRKEGNNFVDIAGESGPTLTVDRAGLDWNGAVLRVAIGTLGISKNTDEATINVTPETVAPTVIRATGIAPLQRVVVNFSEPLDEATAQNTSNYSISRSGGSLSVVSATLLGNKQTVLLETGNQAVGTKYTVTVNRIADEAATPNTVSGGQAKFYSLGDLQPQGADGLLVFEAESSSRNLDDLWMEDTERGNPSGGVSMVNPNGAGGNESGTQLEYDLTFTQTGTHIVWYRAGGVSGTDDSGWLWLDGARPANRVDGNQASMTGFSGSIFEWNSDPQDGPSPYTIEIDTPGLHTLALARREDGSFFDKFVITTDPDFDPEDFGPLGPNESRAGAPALPTMAITSPADNTQFESGANVQFTVEIAAASRVVSKVEYFNGSEKIGESTDSPFSYTWENATDGGYVVSALLTDDVGDSVRATPVQILVGQPNDVLFLVGNPDLTTAPSDAAISAAIAGFGFNVVVVEDTISQSSDAFGKLLIVNSSTVNSGDVGTKFRDAAVPVIMWEQANQDDFGMTGNTDGLDRGGMGDQTLIDILATDHPLAAGLPPGLLDVASAPTGFSWGLPNENATRIATIAGNPDQVVIYAYDTGTTMIDGFVAPARRVFTFLSDDAFMNLTPTGQTLVAAAFSWAAGLDGIPGGGGDGAMFTGTRLEGGTIILEWNGGGNLQSAPTVTGPWSNVAGAATPFSIAPSDPQQFYRISQ